MVAKLMAAMVPMGGAVVQQTRRNQCILRL